MINLSFLLSHSVLLSVPTKTHWCKKINSGTNSSRWWPVIEATTSLLIMCWPVPRSKNVHKFHACYVLLILERKTWLGDPCKKEKKNTCGQGDVKNGWATECSRPLLNKNVMNDANRKGRGIEKNWKIKRK